MVYIIVNQKVNHYRPTLSAAAKVTIMFRDQIGTHFAIVFIGQLSKKRNSTVMNLQI
jgi:hypothetical protein